MMRKSGSEDEIIGMRLCIVPSELFVVLPKFIAIIFEHNRIIITRKPLFQSNSISFRKNYFALQKCRALASLNDDKS